MRPDQLPLLTTVTAASTHPSGEWAAVAVSRPDFDADAYVGQLWRVSLDGSGARRITRGFRDTAPQVSPDGRLIAFLRSSPGNPPQLMIVAADGGEPMPVTDAKLGVGGFVFSPDSTRLAYTARVAEEGRYGTTEDVGAGQEDPRQITTFQFQENGLGYTGDQRSHVFLADVPDPGAEPVVKPLGRVAKQLAAGTKEERDAAAERLLPRSRQLTSDDADYSGLAFAPDGGSVVATSSRHDSRDADLLADLYRVSVGGGEPTLLTADKAAGLACSGAVFSGDGAWLFFVGSDLGDSGRDFVGVNSWVYVMPAGGGEPRLLAGGDVDLAAPLWAVGDDAVLAIVRHRGASRLLRVGADGALDVLLEGTAVLDQVRAAGDEPLVSFHDATSTGDLALVRADGLQRLTDFSAGLRAAVTVREPKELEASSVDGYPVHGWVVVPDGDGPHPVLLNIHGGPYAEYTPAFFDEAQVYAEAGYAVVMCNPRGSASYGSEHGRAIRGDFGNLDAADVLAFLGHAVATVPGLDGDRVGVMGGSYGGYLTAWLIGHDHRWAGAIVERGFLDPASFVGSSDIGWFFTEAYNGPGLDRMNAQSPTLLTDRVTTPTLVLHSEQDLRCPLSQALRYYAQLKLAGVEAELLVFPGENHELSRSGTPWHRRQRFEAILDWWARHLPVGTDPA